MSGWDDKKLDCETCKNWGMVVEEQESWRHVPLKVVECPDCYPHFLAIVNNEPGNSRELKQDS